MQSATLALRDLIRQQSRSIPKYVDEYNQSPNSQSCEVNPQSNNLELITSILVVATVAPILQLADQFYPLAAGLTVISSITLLLRPSEIRKVTTAAPSTALALRLMGEELPYIAF